MHRSKEIWIGQMATQPTGHELDAMYSALAATRAIVWFDLDGTILSANDHFAKILGHQPEDLHRKSYNQFLGVNVPKDPAHTDFWSRLTQGTAGHETIEHVGKDGTAVFIEATYAPVKDDTGALSKIVAIGQDVTASKYAQTMILGKLDAITRALAIIEFEPDGTIRWANENFLTAVDYRLDEIKGKHHSLFMAPDEASGPDYRSFWEDLRSGESKSGEFKRIGKGGKEIWLQAGYNGIKDVQGKVHRVIKYATDTTRGHEANALILKALETLAAGDLTIRLPDTMSENFSDVRAAFNSTMAHLQEMIQGILGVSASIYTESEGIVTTADELNKRCEQQAATIEQTSAAVEEISKTVQANTSKSEEATRSADQASKQAEDGGDVVRQAIDAMHKIESGSAEIRNIISVIESIAFQTNLLALNAGVEAARAGDAGRGFAVVASEVRALAQRASEAAHDINGLIETSSKEVSEGARLVNETGTALEDIVASVTSVSKGMRTIHQASTEQDGAVAEVNQSISEIDLTTQQTAIVSEKNSASATMLTEQARELQRLVSIFDRSADKTPVAAPRPPSAVAPDAPSFASSRPAPRAAEPARAAVAPAAAMAVDEEDDDWSMF